MINKTQFILISVLAAFNLLAWSAAAKSIQKESYNSDVREVRASDLALLRLVTTNNITKVEHLLEQGASANVVMQDKNRRSALILATAAGHIGSVKALINSGADIEYQDSAGLTALSWSVIRKKNKLTEYLLSVNANANTLDNRSITPLMFAVGTGNIKIVEMLVKSNAQLNAKSLHSRMTPLLIAVENNDAQITRKLLDLNANVDAANDYGYTPLMAAAEAGHLEILKILIRYGANVKIQNLKGMTALNLANSKGHWQIVNILKNQ